MKEDNAAFIQLFKEVCEKCFGYPLTEPLSEPDSKLLSLKILEHTGLVIGQKSLRNYSLYVVTGNGNKKENPSVATLDTLARFVLNAPYTTEPERKKKESHYPYWFQYRQATPAIELPGAKPDTSHWKRLAPYVAILFTLIISAFFLYSYLGNSRIESFTDEFNGGKDSLLKKNWAIKSLDARWWNKTNQLPGHFTLYTLRGENRNDTPDSLLMRNIVYRKISGDCFVSEAVLTGFIPLKNWQQAGILLSEDSSFRQKVLRVSLSYNDFFAGYISPPEIIVQGISSVESAGKGNPEEFVHLPIFKINEGELPLVEYNLSKFVLKVEKHNKSFRFLYATGPMKDFAFKEAYRGDFDIQPKYIALFASQGFSKTEDPIPVNFDSFSFQAVSCKK